MICTKNISRLYHVTPLCHLINSLIGAKIMRLQSSEPNRTHFVQKKNRFIFIDIERLTSINRVGNRLFLNSETSQR